MVRIISPDPYYCGTIGAAGSNGTGQITFRDGQAVTDDPAVIAYCREIGYQIVEDQDTPAPPPGNASQEAWAEFFVANLPGADEEQIRAMSRDDLRDLYASTHDPK